MTSFDPTGEIATCTGEQLEQAVASFVEKFAIATPVQSRSGVRQRGDRIEMPDPVAGYLIEQSLVLGVGRSGELQVSCPWATGHSVESGPSESCYFPAGSGGHVSSAYVCLHASCAGRTVADFERAIGYDVAAEFADLVGEPEEPPAGRFRAVPAGEFAKGEPPSWLVKGVLPRAALVVIYGASGAGKSFLALDVAAAVALGVPWREHKVKQANVLYIAAEGAGGFRSRVKAFQHEHRVEPGDAFQIIAGQPNFLGTDDPREIIAEAKRVGAGVVLIDTLAQITPGGDENSAKDMGQALKQCRRVHDATGATVLLIHHAGKDASKGARGWSGLRAACDAEIEVAAIGNARVAKVTKQKDGREGQEFGFKLVSVAVGVDEDGDEIESCVVKPADVLVDADIDADAIIEALGDQAWRSDRRSPRWAGFPVAERLGLDPNRGAARIEQILQRAVFDGLVEQVQLPDNRRNMRPHLRVCHSASVSEAT